MKYTILTKDEDSTIPTKQIHINFINAFIYYLFVCNILYAQL